MIGYLEGVILKKRADRILLLAGHVGYELLLPAVVMDSLRLKSEGDPAFFYVYYHQTERQPAPVLIGFNSEEEKEFFRLLISVETIGPLKAAQALTLPVSDIAAAIEARNATLLGGLKGIGSRTAQKIIATLHGKVGQFVGDVPGAAPAADTDSRAFIEQTMHVLVGQLGYRTLEARQMIFDALQRQASIATPEALLEEIFKTR
ncbi:MAG: Holliday junction branch migration protein RuvA [Thermodesulfobacteriota bacterium]